MTVAAAGLVGYATYYKTLFDSGSTMRVWEDTYGRSLFFFFSSVLHFLYCGHYNENISFFELESKVRWLFAFRLATIGMAYGFLALAISCGRGVAIPILVIAGSQGYMRLVKKSQESAD
jgi:hypothetical protein